MKTVIINGSPRKNGNTSIMCESFAQGIRSKRPDAEIAVVNLYDYTFTGCRSCFACKLKNGKSYGRCSILDDLTPVLELAASADCLVIASPIYLMDITGVTKSFLERLCFSLGSYEVGYRSLSSKRIKTVTIYTMNCPSEMAPIPAMDNIERFLGHIFFSSPERICAFDTYQFSDYSKYVVDVFSEVDKNKHRSDIFPIDLERAFNLGVKMAE